MRDHKHRYKIIFDGIFKSQLEGIYSDFPMIYKKCKCGQIRIESKDKICPKCHKPMSNNLIYAHKAVPTKSDNIPVVFCCKGCMNKFFEINLDQSIDELRKVIKENARVEIHKNE